MSKYNLEKLDGVVSYEPENNIVLKIFKGIFILGFLYLFCHLCILYGTLKERESRNCISGSELIMWENTLETAQAICVDVQTQQLETIENNYQQQNKQLKTELEKWKGYYSYQKKELESLKSVNK